MHFLVAHVIVIEENWGKNELSLNQLDGMRTKDIEIVLSDPLEGRIRIHTFFLSI